MTAHLDVILLGFECNWTSMKYITDNGACAMNPAVFHTAAGPNFSLSHTAIVKFFSSAHMQ